MTRSAIFWMLMILWLVFSFWSYNSAWQYAPIGNVTLIFVLFALLGWQVYGPVVKG